MLKALITRLLERRHFWRVVDFGELSELYATRLLRILAVNMMSIFTLVYLLRNGFGLPAVMLYGLIYGALKLLSVWPSGYIVARIGPKHSTLISNIFYAAALISLSFLPKYGVVMVGIFAIIQAFSTTLYSISHMVNFSKVKHIDHAGKELGFMYTMEKIATALSPLIGGLVATTFGAEWTLYIATVIFFIAAAPLFFTPEPVETHQKIRFSGINWRRIWPSLVGQGGIGIDQVTSGGVWSLFLALIVFAGSGDAVYAQVGATASITLLSGLLVARIFGILIDRKKSAQLLVVGAFGNSVLHLVRPLIATPGAAISMNMANEVFTTGYNLPFLKGIFDMADSLPGYRIAYVATTEIALDIGMMVGFGVAFFCVTLASGTDGLKTSFLFLGCLTLLISFNGFRALWRR
jgi:MFS family permease